MIKICISLNKTLFEKNKFQSNKMASFSTEYFIPIINYELGIPLKCSDKNNNLTDGKITVFTPQVS